MGTLLAYFLSDKEVKTPDLYKDVRAAIFVLPTGKNYQVTVTFLTWERRTWGDLVRPEDFRIRERKVKHFAASSLNEAATIISELAQFSRIETFLQELQGKEERERNEKIPV